MTNDRNYLRMLSDSELIQAANDSGNELAIVMAERLSEMLDVEDDLAAAKDAIKDIARRCDILTDELTALENDQ
jgi:predicted DNA-binding ArsR family transcriptional regulator